MFRKLAVRDLPLKGAKVLTRVDFNVPLDKEGRVADATRIEASLPTIRYMMEKGARIILMSHLGRPKGKRVEGQSLAPAGEKLSAFLHKKVVFADDCIGEPAKRAADSLKDGDVALLENLRFHPEEEANDDGFSRQLASLGELYVNDAFGSAHRAHASTVGVTKHIKLCAAGFLMQKEVEYLGKILGQPGRPFVAVLGGAKVSDKIGVARNLLGQVDKLLVGGGMMFTFLVATGLDVGRSILETESVPVAKEIMEEAKKRGVALLLPSDCLVSSSASEEAETRAVSVKEIPADMVGVDIGPRSVEEFREALSGAKTVLWNGPMGIFEIERYARGTVEIARMLADLTSSGAVTVIGGGDSAAAVTGEGLEHRVSHVSTGGGASLEFLEGRELPGIAALSDKL
ncbi:MAG: phosphoglycerate kinase [Candidatus Eiseniibacteriota bacterium]|nr:MAG: phosphoglycerate kinase [Candidatus Eisenbacteria bacterium]